MRSIKKIALPMLKLAATGFLVYWVIASVGFDSVRKSFAVGSLRRPFFVAVFISVVFSFLKTYKWHILLQQTRQGADFRDSLCSYLAGMAGGLATPGRIGEVSRFVFLQDHKKSLVVSLVFIDRVVDLAIVLALALPGLYYFFSPMVCCGAAMPIAAFFLAFFFPCHALRWLGRLIKFFPRLSRLYAWSVSWMEKMAGMSLSFQLHFLFYTLISYTVVIAEFCCLLANYSPISIKTAALTQPVIMLLNILPITVAGLGVREGAAILLLTHFGIAAPAAFASAFLLFLLNTALPGLAGMLLLLHRYLFAFRKKR